MAEAEMTEDEYEIFGALTAFQFMLENLYALAIVQDGGTADDAKAARDEFLRQFEDLPARNESDLVPGPGYFIRQHALSRLESMWRAIVARVEQ